jgi:endonuclease YncB( thermonuclease family)
MNAAIVKWDAETAAKRLTMRRRVRFAAGVGIGVLLLSVLADHLRAKNSFGDDWARFDGRRVRIVGLVDGDSMDVCEAGSMETVRVKLLGVRPFRSGLSAGVRESTEEELAGKEVVLHLAIGEARDALGSLRADAMMENGKEVSVVLAGEGAALADRESKTAFLSEVERAQAVARRKRLGMW